VRRAVEEIAAELEPRCDGRGDSGLCLKTIYLGGGTPSVLSPASLERLFAALAPFHGEDTLEEWTIELNPEDVTAELLAFLKRSGPGRISLGIQSMNDPAQQILNRCPESVNRQALAAVRSEFDNVSVDVLLGIPGGSVAAVTATAEALLSFEPRHFSVYCLEGSGDIPETARGFLSRIDQEEAAVQYLGICRLLENRGYHHYEVSNFALPGFESRHNLAYWLGDDYLGIGPGAHSFIDGIRWYNAPSIDSYCAGAGGDFSGVRTIDSPGDRERTLERLFLGLRTSRGVPLNSITGEEAVLEGLILNRLARAADDRIVLTDRGFLLLDEIVLRLSGRGNGPASGRIF
jgi:oxygen-independent coproporphyrinogen-3 oxidase